jgi:NAD(P)-dependent dehydrogenase (short-subunit alcohol dehydrogenase family)
VNTNGRRGTQPAVAIFGAAGHTGRFVVAELLRRGIAPIAIARDPAALAAANFPAHNVLHRQASVEDMQSLDRALDGARAVINCAGPFLETADAVANAALRAGIHYLDVTAEQPSARATLEKYDVAAREAGIAVIPSMSFYGGFADLLVTAALGDWDHADTIDVMIGLDSWHPTRGTRITGEKNTEPRMVVAEGRLVPVSSPRSEKDWEFGGPLGRQAMVEVPFSEIVLIARHVKTAELHTWLSRIALDDIRNSTTPAPKPADETGRSPQRFIVDVVATRDSDARRISARGRDIYAFSATLVCEVVQRLLEGKFRSVGAQPPSVIFDAQAILSALEPDHLTIGVPAA